MTFRSLFFYSSLQQVGRTKPSLLSISGPHGVYALPQAGPPLPSVPNTTDHLSALIEAGFLRGSLATESQPLSGEASPNYNQGQGWLVILLAAIDGQLPSWTLLTPSTRCPGDIQSHILTPRAPLQYKLLF